MWLLQLLLLIAALCQGGNTQEYILQSSFSGPSFFDNFNFWDIGDPTFGYVHYLSRGDAEAAHLINSSAPTAKWGVDYTSGLDPYANLGRMSLRLTSKQTWMHGLFVLDLAHMPHTVCGVWPAFWTLGTGKQWPEAGEIDIIEYQNLRVDNTLSLHTHYDPNCTVAGADQDGTLLTADCAKDASYTGCVTSMKRPNSVGTGFNTAGGGVYAMEWTSTAIRIWFFPRNEIPTDIMKASDTIRPNPNTWRRPDANFQGSCDFDAHFTAQQLVFNTDFCGSFAGNAFVKDGCPKIDPVNDWTSCNIFVAQNPQLYSEAYWEVNYLNVYQLGAGAAPPPSSKLSSAIPAISTSSVQSVSGNAQGRSTTPTMPFPLPTLAASSVSPSSDGFFASSSSADAPRVVVVTETVTVAGGAVKEVLQSKTLMARDQSSIKPEKTSGALEGGELRHQASGALAPFHYPKAPLPVPDSSLHSPRVKAIPHAPLATDTAAKRDADPQVLSGGDLNWCGAVGSGCSHRKVGEALNEGDDDVGIPPIMPIPATGGPFLEPDLPISETVSNLETFPTVSNDLDTVYVVVTQSYTTPAYTPTYFTYEPRSNPHVPESSQTASLHERKAHDLSSPDDDPVSALEASETATVSTVPYPPHTCTPVVLAKGDDTPTRVGCGGVQTEHIMKLQHLSVASSTLTITNALPTKVIRIAGGADVVVSELMKDEEGAESGASSTSPLCAIALAYAVTMLILLV